MPLKTVFIGEGHLAPIESTVDAVLLNPFFMIRLRSHEKEYWRITFFIFDFIIIIS